MEVCYKQMRSNHPEGEKMQGRVPMKTGAKYHKDYTHEARTLGEQAHFCSYKQKASRA